MKFTKEEKSWIAYDWANSSYATIVLAAIFPIYFSGVCGEGGDFWLSIGTTCATATAAILSPLVGAIADHQGMKKKLFSLFLMLGVLCTASFALLNSWPMMLVGYSLSYVGYCGSCMLYDSFLPDVTTRERMDTVSSWGYSMGYIGGSTIPFLFCILLVAFGESFGVDVVLACKLSMVICSLWWAVFSIPILTNCQQKHGSTLPAGHLLRDSLQSVLRTLKEMLAQRGLLFFMLAYFFYIDGVNTVILMSTAYGTTLGLNSTSMILALMVVQLVAVPCAIYFGKLAQKFGTINMLTVGICIYFVICITGFIMGFGIEEGFLTVAQATVIFWTLSVMVGTAQGGIQALSRSHFGKLVPLKKSSEYFGVFDIFGKFAAVMGPAIYATTRGITGRSSFAILAIIFLFLMGGIFITLGRPHFKAMAEK